MSADAILASGRAFNVVLRGVFDVQTSYGLVYQEDLINVLGQATDIVDVDDSSVWLSMHPVRGLSTLQAILARPFLEETLSVEFTTDPNFTITPIQIHVDDNLIIADQSLQDRPFTIYIGYADDDWSSYVVWFNGKTIGGVRKQEELRLDLSTYSPLTQYLWPTTVLGNGECSPEILGTVNGITPVYTGRAGFWKFTTTAFTVAGAPQSKLNPYIGMDANGQTYHGLFTTYIHDGSSIVATASETNALPANVTDATTGGDIDNSGDFIQITLPDNSGAGETVGLTFGMNGSPTAMVNGGLFFYNEFDIRMSTDSSVSSCTLGIDIFTVDNSRLFNAGEIYTFRQPLEEITLEGAVLELSKSASNNAHDIIFDILAVRRVFARSDDCAVRVFDSNGKKVHVCQVANVNEYTKVEGVALFDLNGNLLVSEGLTSFTMDAVGADDDIKSIAAINQIADEATGSQASITASFTGEQIGYYANEQMAMIQHVREIAAPLDYIVKNNLTDSDLSVTRRYNRQPVDFDGVAQTAADFTIAQADIVEGSIQPSPIKNGFGRFIARYNLHHQSPQESDVESVFNVKGILTKVKTLNTWLRESVAAANVASLVSRGSAEVIPVSLSVIGQGLGFRTNDVGTIIHRDIRAGIAHLTSVREVGENTEIRVDIYV